MSENIPHLILSHTFRRIEKTALAYKLNSDYAFIKWRELTSLVCDLSAELKAKGIRKGDRVAIISENRPEWVIVDLAVLSCGASLVPLYPQSNISDVEYILNHSESTGLFVSGAEQCEKIAGIQKSLNSLKFIYSFDSAEGFNSIKSLINFDVHSTKKILVKPETELEVFLSGLRTDVLADDEASIIYTSGTTGVPKGVVLTHENICENVKSCMNALPLDESDRLLSFLPLSHVFERTAGYYFALSAGAEIYYAESIATVPSDLKRVKPTVVCSVPRLYEKIYQKFQDGLLTMPSFKKNLILTALDVGRIRYLLKRKKRKVPFLVRFFWQIFNVLVYQKIKQQVGGRLRFFISGGAPLPKDIAEFFYTANILIVEGYGLTETAPVLSVNRINKFKFGTAGYPVLGVEIKIAEDGEILARGRNVMKGYYKDSEATDLVCKDGWLHTGDIGFFDVEGFLRIIDRKKDIIVTAGGKNVSPQNIEQLIVSDRFISQVVVVGDKKPYLTALVVPNIEELEAYAKYKKLGIDSRESLLNLEAMRLLLAGRICERIQDLSKHEKIQYIKLLPEEFTLERGELTPTLKVRRRIIADRYRSAIKDLYDDSSDRIAVTVSG